MPGDSHSAKMSKTFETNRDEPRRGVIAMKYESQQTQYTEKRSVAETLLETLSQSGLGPNRSGVAAVRRSRSRRLALTLTALAIVAAAAVVILWQPRPAADEPIAVVELVRGPARWQPAGGDPSGLLSLGAAQPIHAGASIDTGRSATTRTAVRLTSGPSVRLDAGTKVRWASETTVDLERGAVYVDSAGAASVEVRTALGVVRDIGTQFEVRLSGEGGDEALRVRVREGEVRLETADQTYAAGTGVELSVDGDGVLTRTACETSGSSWDWVLGVAPMPAIDGMALRAFLDWAAREGGWELRYADEAVAERASTIVLHGDLAGLTPVEALEAVFKGSELTYSVGEGELTVTDNATKSG